METDSCQPPPAADCRTASCSITPSEQEAIQLGALLHDIGKFWRRTDEPGLREKQRKYCSTPGAHRDFSSCSNCPKEFKYAHAVLSSAFIDDFVPPQYRASGVALGHHNPQRYGRLAKIVALADRLSSKEREEREDADIAASHVPYLLSIFSRLRDRETRDRYYPLQHLSRDGKTVFPQPKEALPQSQGEYLRLWEAFVQEVERLKNAFPGDFVAYFGSLHFLLQKYTWCIPSAYYEDVPDISLFEHLRTTCAIAAGLYSGSVGEEELDTLLGLAAKEEDELKSSLEAGPPRRAGERTGDAWHTPYWALIGGDLSGVQSFLYTLTSKGVARGLRGRSFYLELLTEVAALWLLRKLELPLASLLYAGGGHFYILSHRLEGNQIEELKREFSSRMLQHHQGDLYLALAQVPLKAADYEDFGGQWRKLTEVLGRAKHRRFGELSPEELHREVFESSGKGLAEETCAICRREGARHPIDPADPEGDRECDHCHSFKEMGRGLAEARYLLISPWEGLAPSDERQRGWKALFYDLGFRVELLRQPEDTPGGAQGLLLKLNDLDFLQDAELTLAKKRPGLALGFRFMANVTPLSQESAHEVADFEELAKASEGIEQIGVLRMDVDDLGKLFTEGLRMATISRVSTLSFLLRLFFEGWLKTLGDKYNPSALGSQGPDKIYVIYSGGDDLFIVGSWDQVARLAQDIRDDFRCFACESVSISGGLVLVPHKFPLYRVAKMAKEALDNRAKERSVNDKVVKDALDFLEQTTDWEEWGQIWEQAEGLKELVEPKGSAPRSLLRLLMGLYEQQRQREDQRQAKGPHRHRPHQLHYGPWMWRGAWALTRLAERLEEPAKSQVLGLRESLTTPQALRELAIAARWTELLLREKQG